jgi:ATP synthase protein I
MSVPGSSHETQSPPATSVSSAKTAEWSAWSGAGSFVGSILSGTLLGYLADLWLNTRPWLIVLGIVLGSYSGFMILYRQSAVMEKVEKRLP